MIFSRNLFLTENNLVFYFIGTCYATIIFYLTIYQIENVPGQIKSIFFWLILPIISSSISQLPKLRCVLALSVFNIISSSGKVLATTWIINSILQGPINNTFENAIQLEKSFLCQFRLHSKLTGISKFKLKTKQNLLKRFKETFTEIQEFQFEISTLMKSMSQELNPPNGKISNGIFKEHIYENFLDPYGNYDFKRKKNSSKKINFNKPENLSELYYRQKISQCMETFESGSRNCRHSQTRFFVHCKRGDIFLRSLCPSLDEVTNSCQLESTELDKNPSQICAHLLNKSDFNDLDQNVNNLNQVNEKFDKNFKAKLDYKLDLKQVKQSAKTNFENILKDFLDFKNYSKKISTFIFLFLNALKIMVNFSCGFVFLNSFKYHLKYLTDVSFDNNCVTNYFKRIDEKRKSLKKEP